MQMVGPAQDRGSHGPYLWRAQGSLGLNWHEVPLQMGASLLGRAVYSSTETSEKPCNSVKAHKCHQLKLYQFLFLEEKNINSGSPLNAVTVLWSNDHGELAEHQNPRLGAVTLQWDKLQNNQAATLNSLAGCQCPARGCSEHASFLFLLHALLPPTMLKRYYPDITFR